MNKNTTLACSTMFCVIAALGTARAATITVTNSADDGAGSFRAAVLASAPGDTILFDAGTDGLPIVLSTGAVHIPHGLVVLGNGAANTTLSGGGTSGILTVESAGLVVLDGLRLIDGNATSGGALHIVSTSIEVRDSEIADCDAAINGGGVYSEDATLTVTNTTIDGCYAAGAAAGQGGGALYATGEGSVTITGSEFTGSGALSEGGGLWNNTVSISLTSSFVGGNYADGDAMDQGGGGIYNNGGSLSIQAGQISSNNARGEYGSGGGILNVNGGTVVATGCAISSNNGARAGGGIESNGAGTTVTLTNVLLEGNGTGNAPDTGSGGGLHITGAGNASITGGTVNNNVASFNGGGLYNGTGTITITDVVLNNNRSRSLIPGDGGGAIYNGGGSVLVNNCWFTNNRADGPDCRGGGVLNNGGSFTMDEGRITGNLASLSGGGIHNVSGTVSLTGVRMAANTASGNGLEDGGAGIANAGTLVVLRSSITGNNATGLLSTGGGVRNTGTATITTSTISGNTSLLHGGGVYSAGVVSITGSTIAMNTAGGTGGGLAVTGAGAATVSGSIIASNTGVADEAQDVASSAVPILSGGYNLIGRDDSGQFAQAITDVEGSSAIPVDPVLAPLALNGAETFTHAIECGSPAVNAGAPADVSADQIGQAVFADRRDMGAFELQQHCACTEIVHLAITLDDNGGDITWELIDNGTNEVLFSGGPYADGQAGTVITEEMCLNKACYRLVVYDEGGDGITDGGYQLSDANGRLIIDANGLYGDDSVIRSALGVQRPFCLPVSNQKLIDSWCGKELRYWNSTQIYASHQPGANAYEFWIFDPHGTYNRFVTSLTQNQHICTFVSSPVPADIWLNVRVRARQGSVWSDFGPACTIRVNSDPERPTLRSVVAEQFTASSFSVFPNPNDGSAITLLLTELPDAQQQVQLELFDLNGRAVERQAFGNDGHTLNRVVAFDATLPPGVYVVRMQVNNALYTERLVVR